VTAVPRTLGRWDLVLLKLDDNLFYVPVLPVYMARDLRVCRR
jgi:hypothetical protein